VPEQVREVLTDSALAIVEVGVADTASLYGDQRLARTRVRYTTVAIPTGAPFSLTTTPFTSCGIRCSFVTLTESAAAADPAAVSR